MSDQMPLNALAERSSLNINLQGARSQANEAESDRRHAQPLRVLIVAPSLDILGGQAVQAERLVRRLEDERSLKVSRLFINPRLPGKLRKLQSVKYLRTVTTSILYCTNLLREV